MRRATIATPPWHAPLPVLQLYVEWRRCGVRIADLARRSGYHADTVRSVLRGKPATPHAVRSIRGALGLEA